MGRLEWQAFFMIMRRVLIAIVLFEGRARNIYMTENTGEIQKAGQFKPGQSGNPAGRPKGSRNKLSEAVINDILLDWELNGSHAIEETRKKCPAQYLRIVAGIIPKEYEAKNSINVSFIDALVAVNNKDKNVLEKPILDLNPYAESKDLIK